MKNKGHYFLETIRCFITTFIIQTLVSFIPISYLARQNSLPITEGTSIYALDLSKNFF
jgi:hypothetical protein